MDVTAARTGIDICMVVHAYYPLAEPRVEREARAAVAAGHRVRVVCLRQAGEPVLETVDGVEVHRLPVSHVRGVGPARMAYEYAAFTVLASWALARLGRRRRIDIVQVHTPPDFLVLAGVLPKARGASLVLDVHDVSAHLYAERFAGRPGAGATIALLGAVERAACALADRVITVHDPYRRELSSRGVPIGKVGIVMNSADERLIAEARAAAASGRRDGTFTVAYHGTITSGYGVDLIVEALGLLGEAVPGARALILGDGDALPPLRQRAAASGLDGRVSFSGRYVPIADALAAVAGADCGIVPNRSSVLNRFALSSKLLEYVALEVPAVVARLPTLAAHFAEDEVTFFEPDRPAALAGAIRWVAEHPREACEKAARARRRAQAYSWGENRRRYLELLATCVPR